MIILVAREGNSGINNNKHEQDQRAERTDERSRDAFAESVKLLANRRPISGCVALVS